MGGGDHAPMQNNSIDLSTPITTLTFGTSACDDDYRTRLTVMARELALLSPDILLLQDVFATADHRYNTAAHLARHLGLHYAFQPARPKIRHLDGRPIDSHCGLAVLTRHRLIASAKIDLPQDVRDGERIAQFVDLDIDGMRLLVINVRVSHLAGADALRRHQIERLAGAISGSHDFDTLLVGGDFNAGADDPLLAPLRNLDGFCTSEAAPGRGVDHLFALTRGNAVPVALAEGRAVLDRADPLTNLFPGHRAALVANLTFARPSRRLPRLLALQTAAE